MLFPFLIQAAGDEIKSPSDLQKEKNMLIPTIQFISFESADFRLLFCSSSILQSRIRRSVCVIDNLGTAIEVAVADDDTVGSLVRRAKVRDFNQLRIITQNSIEQSPVVRRNTAMTQNVIAASDEERLPFLKLKIRAGDFLIIPAIIEVEKGRTMLYSH